jgi:hypothetical protein
MLRRNGDGIGDYSAWSIWIDEVKEEEEQEQDAFVLASAAKHCDCPI